MHVICCSIKSLFDLDGCLFARHVGAMSITGISCQGRLAKENDVLICFAMFTRLSNCSEVMQLCAKGNTCEEYTEYTQSFGHRDINGVKFVAYHTKGRLMRLLY